MQLPICGPSYVSSSTSTNYQRCVNMYVIEPGPNGRGKNSLVRTPGLQLLTNLGNSPIRGLRTVGNYVWAVMGNTVYRILINVVTQTATSTMVGTIGSNSGPVYLMDNPSQIMIVDGTTSGYCIDQGSLALTTVGPAQNFLGSLNIEYYDGYFVCCQPGTNILFSSNLNDGTTWNALNYAANSQRPGLNVGVGMFRGEFWAFSTTCTEIWYDNANSPGFPLSVRQGMGFDIGCAATGSIVEIDNVLMWLDTRGWIVESTNAPYIRAANTGYALTMVSTDAINNTIAEFVQVSDAVAYQYTCRGHLMYVITFPNANATLVYDRTTKQWHEMSHTNTFTGSQDAHLSRNHCKFQTLDLVGDNFGNIYIMSPTVYTDNGTSIRCLRTTQPVNTEFQYFGIDCLEVRMNSGLASAGTTPLITMRFSNDGSNNWSWEESRPIGSTGSFGQRIRWNRLGSAIEWEFEFVIDSNTSFSIIDASIQTQDIEDQYNEPNSRQP